MWLVKTSVTLSTFFLFMKSNVEVQRRAQAEIDSVVGFDRLVQLKDRPHLPYVTAVIREIMRSHVAQPLGM